MHAHHTKPQTCCFIEQKLAAEHADVIASLRATMKARGVQLPKSHFADPDVELARYAVTVGLLTANTPEEKWVCCLSGFRGTSSMSLWTVRLQHVTVSSLKKAVSLQRSADRMQLPSFFRENTVCAWPLLQARTGEVRACRRAVVEAAAVRAQQTVEWLESHSFMPEEQLGQWTHVVRCGRLLVTVPACRLCQGRAWQQGYSCMSFLQRATVNRVIASG